MPQMGPMSWMIFLFTMLILVVMFVTMIHDSSMEKIERVNEKVVDYELNKWW